MKHNKIIIITAIFVLLVAGSIFTFRYYKWNHPPYSSEINAVLFMAGNNRSQLEKVLKHYSLTPSDSLKLRAAEFLIVNMPDKYSVEYNTPFENLAAAYLRWDPANKQAISEIYGLNEPVVKEDVRHITAEYLINNIELAFKVWDEQPWGKNIPFDVFCEEILPYRVAGEPLENWREKVLVSFDALNRSFKRQPGITSVEACSQVNSQLPRFRIVNGLPEMNYSMIMTVSKGTCEEMTAITLFAMRALGIPVSQDCTPKWTGRNMGHIWNSVYDSVGKRVSFMGAEFNPGRNHQGLYMSKSKVYRMTFSKQNNIDADDEDIPSLFRSQYMKDITSEYITSLPSGAGAVPVKYQPSTDTGYAWLAAIGENTWNIVGWGKTDSQTIDFGTVGRNILHLPVYYEDDTQMPANYPFIIDDKDSVRIFEPDTGNYRQLLAPEIFPSGNTLKHLMVKGVFEGANRSDFSDAQVLYTVQKIDGAYFHKAKVRNSSRFRYVRYVSPEKSNCNVAEIRFYNAAGEKLRGKPVGTPGSYQNCGMTFEKAFDGDISTYYNADAEQPVSWTGLDLGEPKTVAEIQYLPRNDGNSIYEGHTYELYWWYDKRWQLFEKQTATSHFLTFRVPDNALFHIRNVTTGKSGKWFVINENGEQQWN